MPTLKHSKNMVRAKQRHMQEGAPPDYVDIDSREYWTEIIIKQHSPHGIKEDVISLFMPHNRIDSFYVKDGKAMLMGDTGLLKMGAHRLMAWIARNKFVPVRRTKDNG